MKWSSKGAVIEMDEEKERGRWFSDELKQEIRSKIYMVDHDQATKRIYFENAGGAPTLKKICELADTVNRIPDFHTRPTPGARPLAKMIRDGLDDAKLIFGAKSGSILCELTVSKALFTMTGVIMRNVPGTNVVSTELEHPSTHDGAKFFAQMLGKEFRTANIDKKTGAVDIDDLLSKIDKDTCLLSVIQASNVVGTINDVETIVREARRIKPDHYILLDSTQHIPHGVIDVEALQIDAYGFAPYKILSKRGLGVGWVSDRVATMPHPHFLEGAADDWDLGGYEPAGMAGLTEIVNYICWIGSKFSDATDRRALYVAGMHAIELDERAIMYRLLHGSDKVKGTLDIDHVDLYFMDDLTKRDAILPLCIHGMDSHTALEKYIANNIYVYERSRKNKMSRRILEGAGIPDIVRVAPMHFNTKEEVDEFLRVTAKIASGEI